MRYGGTGTTGSAGGDRSLIKQCLAKVAAAQAIAVSFPDTVCPGPEDLSRPSFLSIGRCNRSPIISAATLKTTYGRITMQGLLMRILLARARLIDSRAVHKALD